MGVFSRTMMMLTLAWLVGLMVMFLFMNNAEEPSWREKFLAEANTRRAIAYRYVDIKSGMVAEYGHSHGPNADTQSMTPESLGAAPYGLPDQGSSLSTDPLPGSLVPGEASLIETERRAGQALDASFTESEEAANAAIRTLNDEIKAFQRARRTAGARLGSVRESARQFALNMKSMQYIIASTQQRMFNLDFEIHRALVERAALAAELAQVMNDIRRIDGQSMTLEDSYYELTKSYDRAIKVLAWYEQMVPNLRQMADTAGPGHLRGRVVGVGSDPRTGFVSISLGAQSGVKVGQLFTVFRNERFIGRMKIEHVQAKVATGRMTEEFRGVVVAEGDSVKTAEVFGGATLNK